MSRVVDSDWIIASVLRMISGAFSTFSGYAMAEPAPVKKRLAPKRKCKFNEDWKGDFAWIAKFPDCGMAQSGLWHGSHSREVRLIRLPSDSIADRGHISLIINRYYAICTDK